MSFKNYRVILKEFCDKYRCLPHYQINTEGTGINTLYSSTASIDLEKFKNFRGQSAPKKGKDEAKEEAAKDLVKKLKENGVDIQLKEGDRQTVSPPADPVRAEPKAADVPINLLPNSAWERIGAIEYIPKTIAKGKHIYEGRFESYSVVVKRILSSQECGDQAKRELDAYIKLARHPHIVHYFCHEKDKDFIYIAIESCQISLEDFLDDKNIQQQVNLDRKEMLKQMTKGLEYLHYCKIVHRDIKPSNILVGKPDPRGKIQIKLADFGLSKSMYDNLDFSMSGIKGTRGWIAPEVYEMFEKNEVGNSKFEKIILDVTIDIFSLGCVFYYLLTDKQHPFGQEGVRESSIRKGKFSLNILIQSKQFKGDCASITDLIQKMISSEPKNRPPSFAILKHPYFWKPKKTIEFVLETADFVKAEANKMLKRQDYSQVVDNLESNKNQVIGNDWTQVLVTKIKQDNHFTRGNYCGLLVRDLLRFLRNTKHHIHEIKDDVKKLLGGTVSEMCLIWTDLFPNLIYHTWIVFSKLKDTPEFEDYYDNIFDFSPSDKN